MYNIIQTIPHLELQLTNQYSSSKSFVFEVNFSIYNFKILINVFIKFFKLCIFISSTVEAARKSNISAVSCKIVKYIFLSR